MPRGKGGPAAAGLLPIHITLGANPEIVDSFVFTATGDYEVLGVSEVHDVAGTDVGAVILNVRKCAPGTSVAAGTSVLTSTFDLKSTADTPVRKTVSNGGIAAAYPTRLLKDGEALAIDFSGVTTALVGVAVTIWLKPVSRPAF